MYPRYERMRQSTHICKWQRTISKQGGRGRPKKVNKVEDKDEDDFVDFTRNKTGVPMSQYLDWLEEETFIIPTAMDFHPPRRVWRYDPVHLSVHR